MSSVLTFEFQLQTKKAWKVGEGELLSIIKLCFVTLKTYEPRSRSRI